MNVVTIERRLDSRVTRDRREHARSYDLAATAAREALELAARDAAFALFAAESDQLADAVNGRR